MLRALGLFRIPTYLGLTGSQDTAVGGGEGTQNRDAYHVTEDHDWCGCTEELQ
jgi:hypothetical protein